MHASAGRMLGMRACMDLRGMPAPSFPGCGFARCCATPYVDSPPSSRALPAKEVARVLQDRRRRLGASTTSASARTRHAGSQRAVKSFGGAVRAQAAAACRLFDGGAGPCQDACHPGPLVTPKAQKRSQTVPTQGARALSAWTVTGHLPKLAEPSLSRIYSAGVGPLPGDMHGAAAMGQPELLTRVPGNRGSQELFPGRGPRPRCALRIQAISAD